MYGVVVSWLSLKCLSQMGWSSESHRAFGMSGGGPSFSTCLSCVLVLLLRVCSGCRQKIGV